MEIISSVLEVISGVVDWLMLYFDSIPILSWVLFPEEKLTLWLDEQEVSVEWSILLVNAGNLVHMALMMTLFHLTTIGRLRWRAKNLADTGKLNSSSVSCFDLCWLGFTPGLQKFGVWALYKWFFRRKYKPVKGLAFLLLGGLGRTTIYPLLGEWLILVIVVIVAAKIWKSRNWIQQKVVMIGQLLKKMAV